MFAICKAGFLTILLDLFNSISTSSFKFRLRVLVTIATSRGLRRTVSSKWLEHATDGWSCPTGVQGEGVQSSWSSGHPSGKTSRGLQSKQWILYSRTQRVLSYLVLHRVQEVHKIGKLPYDAVGLVEPPHFSSRGNLKSPRNSSRGLERFSF